MPTLSGMRFAICNEIFEGWKLEDTFAYASRLGYAGVEIAPFTIANRATDISPAERQRIRAEAARNKVQITALHWVLAKTEGFHLTHPDAGVRERTADYIIELVRLASDLGAGWIVFGSPKQREVLPGVTQEQAAEWAAAVFGPGVEEARRRGVVICLEPLGPAETNFMNTAAEAIQFTRRLDSPNFKIILDVKAMSSEQKAIPEIIRESWPHFVYFHANDKNLKGPGFGDVDFRPIAATLKEVGYDGFVSVEVFNFEEGAEVIAAKSIEYLRRVFG